MSKDLECIDKIDQEIITILQNKPLTTHTEIAKLINRSQPTVGLRIKKLEKSGIITYMAGISLKKTDLYLAMLEIETDDPNEILNISLDCPFIVNAFRLTGRFNISVLISCFNLDKIDEIINEHFRNNENVKNMKLKIISDMLEDIVIPTDILDQNRSSI